MTKTILILFFLFILCPDGFSQYLWEIYPDSVVKWDYYAGDEFDRQEIDRGKWLTCLPWSRSVISQDIHYLDTNTYIRNGYACFDLKKQQAYYGLSEGELNSEQVQKNKVLLRNGNQYRFEYSGGLLWSKQQYQYGYFEIKFKAEAGRGVWPAFWLYGGNPNNEIDFFELKGEKQKALHVDVHCPEGCSNYITGWFGYRKAFGHWIKTKEPVCGTDNIVSGEWAPDHISWYLNGELIASIKQGINLPMNLTFGTGAGKDKGPFGPGPDNSTKFPNTFMVDYVRVYTKSSYTTAHSDRAKLAPVTLSVIPLSEKLLSVRVLGMKNADSAVVNISDVSQNLVDQKTIRGNTEYQVAITNINLILIQAWVKGHKITQSLNYHYEIPKN